MKIAVSSKGAGLGAWLDPEFSHCNHFVVVDDSGGFEFWDPDDQSKNDPSALIDKLVTLKVSVLITGLLDKELEAQLRQKGIDVISADKGSVLELVEKYKTSTM